MRKVFFIGFLWVISISNYAQLCNGINIDTLHGKWVKDPYSNSLPNESKTDLLRERQNMEAVNDYIKKIFNWVPIGGDIGYGFYWDFDDHRPSPIINISHIYYTRFGFEKFNCDNNKIKNGHGSDYFTTIFNDLPFTFDYTFFSSGSKPTDAKIDPRTDLYAALKWLPEVKDGYFDYIQDNLDGTGKNAEGLVYRFRTIVKPGKLPYLLMSKKEYYEKWKIKQNYEIENIEATKASMIKDLQGNPYLSQNLEVQNQNIALTKNYLNKIDAILKNKTSEELSKPAYVGEEYGEYFESVEASEYKAYIVKPNLAYYDYNLNNKSSPQVITIYLRYGTGKDEHGNRIYADTGFYKSLEDLKIFDLLAEKLKTLIVQ